MAELGTTSQSNGLAINGQRANQIGFYFDGIDTRTETSGKPAFSPSIEAIQEFKIQQNNFSAEYGRNPPAINLTLSRNQRVSRYGIRIPTEQCPGCSQLLRPAHRSLRRNQFGGVLSGPIVRNKTFFMGNYEGLRTRRATTLYQSVPTASSAKATSPGARRSSIRSLTMRPLTGGSRLPETSFPRAVSARSDDRSSTTTPRRTRPARRHTTMSSAHPLQ